MKRNIFAFTTVFAIVLMMSSCAKYEEGPSFSLLTKKARITGVWKFDQMFEDGVEITLDDDMKNSSIEILKDGTASMKYVFLGATITMEAEWEFNDDKTGIKMRMKDITDGTWEEWEESEILRLTNSELWMRDTTMVGSTVHNHDTYLIKE